ncbi:MAG: hypothetical protein H7070_13845 [Saprospiraceae bacterium]|nr:hypothetical protein [Pyrinomonadaceae bacterium]
MTYSPLAMKRRHVLGDIYAQCNSVESIPVYMESKTEDPIGFVDESMGIYADTFLFHLPEDVCKKLSAGHYIYSFDYEVTEIKDARTKKRRYELNYILLTGRKAPTPVVRASKKNAQAEIEAQLEAVLVQ